MAAAVTTIPKGGIEHFEAFFEVSRSLLSSASLKEILDLLVRRAVRVLDVKAGSLRLLDEKTHRLEPAASHGLSKGYLEKGPLDADQSIPEVLQGKIVLIKDAQKDPRIQYRAEKVQEGIHTILTVPVLAGKKVIGVLRLYTKTPRDFEEDELEFVSALAEMGGLAIANARIHEKEGVKLSTLLGRIGVDLPEAKSYEGPMKPFVLPDYDHSRSMQLFRILRDVTTAILSSLNSREIVDLILEKVREIMKVKGCSLRLINETTRELDLLAHRGLSEAFLRKGPVSADRSIGEAMKGHPVFVADVTRDPRVQYPLELMKEGIASILSLPITAQTRVIGVLRLYGGEPREYLQDEVAFLLALAEIAGIVIVNAKLYEQTAYDLSFWETTVDYLKE
jgi:signal transduction protein with GAF and PtsI domain